jgi:O-antigen/teichoic acid export membrane protein
MYPINYAIDPIYLGIHQREGVEKTQLFLSKTLSYFLMFVLPVCFGFAAIGKDLLHLLATSKYAGAETIIYYVVAANAIYACQVIFNAGLIINKKTHVLMKVKIISCIINICLNLILIPLNGIVGAAQATLISYVFYTVTITWCSFKELSFRIDYLKIFRFTISSLLMFILMGKITIYHGVGALLIKIVIGTLFYICAVLCIDREIRSISIKYISKNHEI